jgi:hypothetical protein
MNQNNGRIQQMIAGRRSNVLRGLVVLLEYLALIAYFGYLWLMTPQAETASTAQYIGNIVFAQFLGFFITAILGTVLMERITILQLLLVVLAFGAFGFWLLLDFSSSPAVAFVWIVSIIAGLLTNWENAFGNALASLLWLMFAGFLAALVGSMSGIPEDALLSTNLATVAGWGILYYIGLLLADGSYLWKSRSA